MSYFPGAKAKAPYSLSLDPKMTVDSKIYGPNYRIEGDVYIGDFGAVGSFGQKYGNGSTDSIISHATNKGNPIHFGATNAIKDISLSTNMKSFPDRNEE